MIIVNWILTTSKALMTGAYTMLIVIASCCNVFDAAIVLKIFISIISLLYTIHGIMLLFGLYSSITITAVIKHNATSSDT